MQNKALTAKICKKGTIVGILKRKMDENKPGNLTKFQGQYCEIMKTIITGRNRPEDYMYLFSIIICHIYNNVLIQTWESNYEIKSTTRKCKLI